MEATAIEIRLRNTENRLDSNHTSISTLRSNQAAQATEIAVIHTELSGAREDIKELGDKMDAELGRVRRGLWLAAGAFASLALAAGTLILQIATGG